MKTILLTSIALSAFAFQPAFADETLKWRHVQHTESLNTLKIPDGATDHTINQYTIPGLAMYSDGTFGTSMVIGNSDLKGTHATVRGYNIMKTADGSELYLSYVGETNREGNHMPRKGTFTVIGGTGKFANAKGEGTWQGDGPLNAPGAISYIDCVVNLKK
jgi:hypothetical protein